MRYLAALLLIFVLLLSKVDRLCLKASHRFCLHYIDVPLSYNPSWDTTLPYPAEILEQPFSYLDKGAQNFVFESQDKKYVLKLYKFPSRLRRFGWVSHPFSPFSDQKNRGLNKFQRTYNSYFLASQHLSEETGVVYVHLNPTAHRQKIHLKDRAGHLYDLPVKSLGFVVQQKGKPFLSTIRSAVENRETENAKKMIAGLLGLIASDCAKGIIDLDRMNHDNYGWAHDRAIHLDIGRLTIKNDLDAHAEAVRITHQLNEYLSETSPELSDYYKQQLVKLRVCPQSPIRMLCGHTLKDESPLHPMSDQSPDKIAPQP